LFVGKILLGGDRPQLSDELKDGYYLNPTIITGLSATCRTQQEEIFGPVVGITTFKTEEEGKHFISVIQHLLNEFIAIEIANGAKFGLAAMVWSENVKRVHRVAPQLEAGTVWVNCWMMVTRVNIFRI
jgi:aminomuconate-semialdehyde/2-hydroxymuconate-6-semialdehyde dehydrogenase